MNDGFAKLLGSYNDAQLEELRQASLMFGKYLFIFFDGMRQAGFNDLQALELTKAFQLDTLNKARGKDAAADE